MRILVVDDEKIKRITLADDLAAQGHDVVTAADGEEALEKLVHGRFDVVVTDLKMPKLDGIELLKRIKYGKKNSGQNAKNSYNYQKFNKSKTLIPF